jgi:hypothetical protein
LLSPCEFGALRVISESASESQTSYWLLQTARGPAQGTSVLDPAPNVLVQPWSSVEGERFPVPRNFSWQGAVRLKELLARYNAGARLDYQRSRGAYHVRSCHRCRLPPRPERPPWPRRGYRPRRRSWTGRAIRPRALLRPLWRGRVARVAQCLLTIKIAAFRAQRGLGQLSAISGHYAREKALAIDAARW